MFFLHIHRDWFTWRYQIRTRYTIPWMGKIFIVLLVWIWIQNYSLNVCSYFHHCASAGNLHCFNLRDVSRCTTTGVVWTHLEVFYLLNFSIVQTTEVSFAKEISNSDQKWKRFKLKILASQDLKLCNIQILVFKNLKAFWYSPTFTLWFLLDSLQSETKFTFRSLCSQE